MYHLAVSGLTVRLPVPVADNWIDEDDMYRLLDRKRNATLLYHVYGYGDTCKKNELDNMYNPFYSH